MSEQLEKSVANLTREVEILAKQVGKMGEVLIQLARIEESAKGIKEDVDGFGKRLSKFEEKLRVVEIKSAVQASTGAITSRVVERIVMFIVLAALASWNLFKD